MENENIWQADDKREMEKVIDFRTECCKSRYDDTGNPLHVWNAIQIRRDDDREYPKWIKNYLSDVADELLRIRDPRKDAPPRIKRALKIISTRDFSKFHKSWRKIYAYDRVVEERKKRLRGDKRFIYLDIGEEFDVSDETIKKWYLDEKRWLDKIIEED